MTAWTRKTRFTTGPIYKGRHRLEHWYRDNQVYFITARCRDKHPAFAMERAIAAPGRSEVSPPCVPGALNGVSSGQAHARRTDISPQVNTPGGSPRICVLSLRERSIRNERQCRRAFRYTLTQSVRHGICTDWREYPHTHVKVDLERGVKRALQLKAFLEGVPYKRHQKRSKR